MNDKQNIREALKQAVDHWIERHHCTTREARRRIYQSARAKKAELGHVARMIIADQVVDYHYNVPSTTYPLGPKTVAQDAPPRRA